MDGALYVMQEGVEVELLLARSDIELHILLAVHGAKAGDGIESARAASVIEPHLGDGGGDVISNDKATEGHYSIQRYGQVLRFAANGNVFGIQEGIRIALSIRELDLGQVGH